MTTYESFEAAKIENPESDIYKLIGMGGFVFGDGLGDLIRVSSLQTNAKKCNPADHCMTVEKFLADGHKFVEGDAYLCAFGFVNLVGDEFMPDELNEPDSTDCDRYILRAAALEENPSEKVEWVNGDIVNTPDGEGCLVAEVYRDGYSYWIVQFKDDFHPFDLSELSKPETKQQREDRERLEAAYDLYLSFWSASKSSTILESYDEFSSRGNSDLKHFLAVVDKTNYRKEVK